MAAFQQLHWHEIDAYGIVIGGGIATIEEQDHETYHRWLVENGYTIHAIDCARPVNEILSDFNRLLNPEYQVGYPLDPSRRNFDALSEAFLFGIPEGERQVFELVRIDVAWKQEPDWVRDLLCIIREASRRKLALGSASLAYS